jgi:homoserine O-succinyltransferase
MGRFLRGESEVCPTIPKGYFDTKAEEILTAFRRGAITHRDPEFFAGFPTDWLAKDVRNVWQSSAKRIYRNWLLYLEAQRAERSIVRLVGGTARSRPTLRYAREAGS